MTSREQIITTARDWIGVRWQHQGRSRIEGVDCVGLLVVVAQSLGLPVTDVRNYRRRQTGRELLKILDDQLKKTPLEGWKIGDIGVFKESSFPIHVGVLNAGDEGLSVIHAHARRRQVIEEPLAQYGMPIAAFSLLED